jgi:hypothetical protein
LLTALAGVRYGDLLRVINRVGESGTVHEYCRDGRYYQDQNYALH